MIQPTVQVFYLCKSKEEKTRQHLIFFLLILFFLFLFFIWNKCWHSTSRVRKPLSTSVPATRQTSWWGSVARTWAAIAGWQRSYTLKPTWKLPNSIVDPCKCVSTAGSWMDTHTHTHTHTGYTHWRWVSIEILLFYGSQGVVVNWYCVCVCV